jgi:hypothetical protein
MPGKWWGAVRRETGEPLDERGRFLLARCRMALTEPYDVVDWRHSVRRERDVDDAGEVA